MVLLLDMEVTFSNISEAPSPKHVVALFDSGISELQRRLQCRRHATCRLFPATRLLVVIQSVSSALMIVVIWSELGLFHDHHFALHLKAK